MRARRRPLVETIKERCRMCYTCVRECPAKAIRISDRQAEVIHPRCIGCGNCVRVCSQNAKVPARDVEHVRELLASPRRIAAIVAPSFPAEFIEDDHREVVGRIRGLGFDVVSEVAFGADLVARAYKKLLENEPDKQWIATTCPAIVAFVERYHPQLVEHLAPIVSPMIAAARAVRRLHGEDLAIVFIGPCLAKKGEMNELGYLGDIDCVITFRELQELLLDAGLAGSPRTPSDFDRPHAGPGALFPITGGMLQAADIEEDLITADVIAAEGNSEFPEAIREFASSEAPVRLLELLACKGCIMGPGTTSRRPLFRRRARVSAYVRGRMDEVDPDRQRADYARCRDIPLARGFGADDQRLKAPDPRDVDEILYGMGKLRQEDELNCGACGYATCREHAIAISEGLAESEMCLPFMIERLGRTCQDLSVANEQLASTQQALLHAEKLASMGQLAAGIAHEVNNPLSTVLMLSHLLLDEAEEGAAAREDLKLIVSEADRCRTIVSGLLQFARKNKVDAERVDVREVVDRALRGLNPPPEIQVSTDLPEHPVLADIDADQILQVLTNVATNAVHAMQGDRQQCAPRLTVRLQADEHDVRILVADTGTGILAEHRKKIFEPFFTTKPAGKGTGLGLSVSYGIVKMHHGDITVDSNADPAAGPTGTTFRIRLPRRRRAAPPSEGAA